MKNLAIVFFRIVMLTLFGLYASYSYGQAFSMAPCLSESKELMDSDSVHQGVGDRHLLWDVGQEIKVGFIGGSSYQRAKVWYYAKQWESYANIRLIFVESGYTDIRVSFVPNGRHYSRIGTNALGVDQTQNTMNISLSDNSPEEAYNRIVLHEFGHALGLHHEHRHPAANIAWNIPTVYEYFMRIGWSKSEIDWNILSNANSADVYNCEYDRHSIMHYAIDNSLTLNNFSVPWNTVLSREDKAFIERLYPFNGVRSNGACGFCTDDCTDKNLWIEATMGGTIQIKALGQTHNSCAATCSYNFNSNQIVDIVATPLPNFRFVRWEGTDCTNSTTTSCRVIMNRDHSIRAIYEPILINRDRQFTINVIGLGGVAVMVNNTLKGCTNNCTYTFLENTPIELRADAATGYRLAEWRYGSCDGSSSRDCNFTLSDNMTITAVFEPINSEKELSIDFEGMGSVMIFSSINTRSCSSDCSYSYTVYSHLRLYPLPAPGYHFVKFIGIDCMNDTGIECGFTLTSNQKVIAVFEKDYTCSANKITDISSTPWFRQELNTRYCGKHLHFELVSDGYSRVVRVTVTNDKTDYWNCEGMLLATCENNINCAPFSITQIISTSKDGRGLYGNVCGNLDSTSPASSKVISCCLEENLMNTDSEIQVKPNYPNPFSEQTTIPIVASKEGLVNLTIYSITGAQVFQREYPIYKGQQAIRLDTDMFTGPGTYFYQINIGNQMVSGKLQHL